MDKIKCFLRNPFYLLFVYLLLIFGFASLYNSHFSDKFYHSTLKYETAFGDKKREVLNGIQSALMTNFSSAKNSYSETITTDGKMPIYLHIDKLNLENLNVKDDEITFDAHFFYSDIHHFGPGKGIPTSYKYLFKLNAQPKTVKGYISGSTREINAETDPDNPIPAKYLIPNIQGLAMPSIVFDRVQLEKLKEIVDYNNGIIKTNSFWRMLYFSAVTISTIGYGDIVPVDDTLRLVISFEAIIGIIFIGLFINAFGEWLKK